MSKSADKKQVRLSDEVRAVIEVAADQGRRSITEQVDWVLRRVYGIKPVGVSDASEVIKQIREGKEFEVTPNLEMQNNVSNG